MADLLALWHAEHAKFGRLLVLFERELEAFHDGNEPDYALMTDILDYLQGYGDAFHHPREDIGFRRLVEKDPGAAALVQRLLQEHRVIAESGRDLMDKLERLAAGAVIARSAIEGAAATYLVYYRHHLMKEEAEVLPRIGRLFTPDDWAVVAAELELAVDPLFEQVDARFSQLRKHIVRASGEAAASH